MPFKVKTKTLITFNAQVKASIRHILFSKSCLMRMDLGINPVANNCSADGSDFASQDRGMVDHEQR